MSLKAKVEAIIYAAEEPITLEQIAQLLREVVLADLAAAKENAAIEQADSDAEALASNPTNISNITDASNDEAVANETALLPELAADSEELICPEPGPLMPQIAEPEDAAGEASDKAQGEEEDLQQPATESLPDTGTASADAQAATSASISAPETASRKRQPKKSEQEIAEDKAVRARVRQILIELVTDYTNEVRGIEIRQVAGGFRMATKPEHHDVVRAFAKSLKPPIRLSLAALETLAVIAYKQPITGPEIGEIRGVESAGVLGTLLDRKLITTAGRKQVIGRPMQYRTSKDFLLRFGLNDVNELPSMEEFSQLAYDGTIELAPAEQQQPLSLFEPSSTEAATENPAEQESAESEVNAPQHAASLESPEPQQNARQQSDAAEAADSQPQSDAESNNVPEAEHPIGQ